MKKRQQPKAAELAKTLQRYFSEQEQEQILQVLASTERHERFNTLLWVNGFQDIIEQRKQLIERITAEQQGKSIGKA
ncbi:hypothetical protein [Cylindrospermopsis raciborskii]|uniref:Uncharacterized protein n=1 Tax=Cylindrospermopsis raciborskii CS-505 TaxID=533240 RepID=A0A853M5X5_9CYAN|nr:hypothetical protein [Cylindrospermopsis raciborskii]OBU74760.1 hypothetical protein A9P98_17945 [Cylindrospermopsis raciborskii CS-505]